MKHVQVLHISFNISLYLGKLGACLLFFRKHFIKCVCVYIYIYMCAFLGAGFGPVRKKEGLVRFDFGP